MQIVSISENTTLKEGLLPEHGLSLFIKTENSQKILFDTGQSGNFVFNAEKLGLKISGIDFAVISHGHYDHGGGLEFFLKENHKAPVFINQLAFLERYSLKTTGFKFIGLNPHLKDNPRFIKCGDLRKISDEIFLFSNVSGSFPLSEGSKLLFSADKQTLDKFSDEQNLVITENSKTFLFAGCAHCGIINIIEKLFYISGKYPDYVFGGFHLMKSDKKEVEFLAEKLLTYPNTIFYTMHCTGKEQFEIMKKILGARIEYFSCGSIFSR